MTIRNSAGVPTKYLFPVLLAGWMFAVDSTAESSGGWSAAGGRIVIELNQGVLSPLGIEATAVRAVEEGPSAHPLGYRRLRFEGLSIQQIRFSAPGGAVDDFLGGYLHYHGGLVLEVNDTVIDLTDFRITPHPVLSGLFQLLDREGVAWATLDHGHYELVDDGAALIGMNVYREYNRSIFSVARTVMEARAGRWSSRPTPGCATSAPRTSRGGSSSRRRNRLTATTSIRTWCGIFTASTARAGSSRSVPPGPSTPSLPSIRTARARAAISSGPAARMSTVPVTTISTPFLPRAFRFSLVADRPPGPVTFRLYPDPDGAPMGAMILGPELPGLLFGDGFESPTPP